MSEVKQTDVRLAGIYSFADLGQTRVKIYTIHQTVNIDIKLLMSLLYKVVQCIDGPPDNVCRFGTK